MNTLRRTTLLAIFFVALFLFVQHSFAQRQTVIISEVLYDTPLTETTTNHDGEFLSLYNYGNSIVDISGWRVEVTSLMSSSQIQYNYTVPNNTYLNPSSLAIVAARGANSSFNIEEFYSIPNINNNNVILYNNSITLPNTRSRIKIYDADNNLQDNMDYDGSTPALVGEVLLRAENATNSLGSDCYSVQRKNITILNNEYFFTRSDFNNSRDKKHVVLFSFDGSSALRVSVNGNSDLTLGEYNEIYNIQANDGGSEAQPLKGSVSVSASGGATYTVPIDVPAGIRNMQPDLALVYNSQSGMGIAGLGFHLQGLSAITRTSKNLFYDSERSNELTEFMLDGQRLKSLPLEDINMRYIITYETADNPSFNSIIYYWIQDRIVIKTREGMTLYYGDNENSSLRHFETNQKLSYLLREIIDGYGNSIKYSYLHIGGQTYIDKINYGSSGSNVGTEIRFIYKTNPVSLRKYLLGGHEINENLLLSKISIYSNGVQIYYYDFSYETPFQKAYTILRQINKYYPYTPPLLNSNIIYYKKDLPLSFVWSNVNNDEGNFSVYDFPCFAGNYNNYSEEDQLPWYDFNHHDESPAHRSIYVPGDIDGDGAEELVRFGWKYVNVFRNDGFAGNNGIAYSLDFTGESHGWQLAKHPRYVIDMNGDGCGDLVGRANEQISITYSNGFIPRDSIRTLNDQFTNTIGIRDFGVNTHYWNNTEDHPVLFGDIDGDGLTDIVGINDDGCRIYRNLKDSFSACKLISHDRVNHNNSSNEIRRYKLLDINGDGKSELIILNNILYQKFYNIFEIDHVEYIEIDAIYDLDNGFSGENIKTIYRSSDVLHDEYYISNVDKDYGDAYHHLFGDLNGDGLVDMVAMNREILNIHYSHGTDMLYNATPDLSINEFTLKKGYGNLGKNPVSLGDINGDGLLDIIGFGGSDDNASSRLFVLLNTGNNFLLKTWGNWNNSEINVNTDEYGYKKEKLLFDFNGDGVSDVGVVVYGAQSLYSSRFGANKDFRRIIGISDSSGITTSITYGKYKKTKSDTFSYPFRELSGLDIVSEVKTITSSNTVVSQQTYSYSRAIADIRRGSLLGFLSTTVKDNVNNISVTTKQELDKVRSMLYPVQSITKHHGRFGEETKLSTEIYSYSVKSLTLPPCNYKMLSEKISSNSDKNFSVHTYYDIDNFGYRTQERSTIELSLTNLSPQSMGLVPVTPATRLFESEESVQYENYQNIGGESLLKRPLQKITTSGYRGRLLKDTTYYKYNDLGDVLSETTREGTTTTVYNDLGLPVITTFIPKDNPDSSSRRTYTYTSDNRFINSTTDGFGTTIKNYDLKYGRLISETNIYNQSKSYNYDNYGRLKNTIDENGIQTIFTESDNGRTIHAKTSLGASSYTYYDELGREIKTGTETADGTIITESVYDNKGRVSKKSEPYFEGSNNIMWHNYTYDNQGRLIQSEYLGDITTYTYDRLKTTVTEHAGTSESRTISKTYNATGDVINVTEPAGEIKYHYRYPKLPDTIKSNGIKTVITYDDRGRRTSLLDPSAGLATFDYDNQNRLIKQQDANGTVSRFYYDKYGREIIRTLTAKDSNSVGGKITIMNSYNGVKGALSKTTINGQQADNVSNSYIYDSMGRVLSEIQSLDSRNFTTSYSYDAYGRQKTKTYPNSFCIEYKYNDYGELSQITNLDDGSNIWQRDKKTARGQYQHSYLGGQNGSNSIFKLSFYDDRGNLTGRQLRLGSSLDYLLLENKHYDYTRANRQMNYRGSVSQISQARIVGGTEIGTSTTNEPVWKEYFGYDEENRLTSARYRLGLQEFISDTQIYEANGNLEYKNGLGNIIYSSEHPYRIEAINPVSRPSSFFFVRRRELEKHLYSQQITYTPFQRVLTIRQQDSVLTPTDIVEDHADFIYNSGFERVKMQVFQDGNIVKKKYYAGDYEEVYSLRTDGTGMTSAYATEICYIRTPEGLQAAYMKNGTGDAGSLYYFGLDHAGSITSVISEEGEVLQRYLYDAWGNRRVIYDTSGDSELYYPQFAPTGADMRGLVLYEPLFDRGYIGEEHIDLFGLINLNARLYDPVLGRFLSPDPYVQAPDMLQNFNRYTYGLNNPLMYVDPSGEFFWIPVLIGAAIGITVGLIQGHNIGEKNGATGWRMAAYMAVGGLIGGGAGALSGWAGVAVGGALAGVGISGAAGGFISGATAGAAAGFVNGVGMTALGGGTFGESMLAGVKQMGIGAGIGGAVGFFAGGITAAAQGKSFWDGFDYQKALDAAVAKEGINNPDSKFLVANRRNARLVNKTYGTNVRVYGSEMTDGITFYKEGLNIGDYAKKSNLTLISKQVIRGRSSANIIDVIRHEGVHQLQVLSGIRYNPVTREILANLVNIQNPATWTSIGKAVERLINIDIDEGRLWEFLFIMYPNGVW
ncbi:MAG: FG-GAP-like repeat-containing protein [Bacteroidales bacterium]|jgi:RHS repeat-associated protein|nr:FG-GAP-like repeat-containing protein [Bacteroidales bacterium]